MSLPSKAVKHPITTTMVFAAIFILGIISLGRIGQELFPDIDLPTVAAITVSPGVSPFDVESGISERIEKAVGSINGLESVSSVSMESVSQVTISFASGTDMNTAVTDVREAINTVVDDFPDGSEQPILFKFTAANLPILRLNAYTNTSGINIRNLVEDQVVPELERVPGVAQADIFGGTEQAVLAEIDIDRLSQYNIPLLTLMQAFNGENVSLPAGSLRQTDKTLVLRTVGEFQSVDDIGEVLIGYRDNVAIKLQDVANVSMDFLPQEEFVLAQGTDGIRINIQKQAGYNTVQVIDGVFEKLDGLKSKLPPSINFEIIENQRGQILDAIGGVTDSAWQGGLLAIVVLIFFLRNIRSTTIIAIVIPVSIIATFTLIDFGGMTLNLTSLMGITLAVGMFVDNAIVVLESIFRKQLYGLSPEDAAIEGAEEVATSITASTMTTMAVFLPMLFVEGLAGILFRDLSLTITFSLAISLFAALTVIPVLCKIFLRVEPYSKTHPENEHPADHEVSLADVEVKTNNPLLKWLNQRVQKSLQTMDRVYESGIIYSLKHVRFVFIVTATLFVVSVGSVLLLGMEFIPEADEGRFQISVETRLGAPFTHTTEKINQIEQIVDQEAGPYIQTVSSQIGEGASSLGSNRTGSHLGTIIVSLVDKGQRPESIWSIVKKIDDRIITEVGGVRHNIGILGMSALASSAGGGSSPIDMKVKGDDLERLNSYAEQLVEIIASVPGTRSVQNSYIEGKPEIQFRINREQALSLGLSPLEIAASIRTAFSGYDASRFSYGGQDYKVMLIMNEEDRLSEAAFQKMFFVNQAGTRIPLENVVEIYEATGPIAINRQDRTRLISVTASLTGERALSEVSADINRLIEGQAPPPVGVELEFGGSSSEMVASFESLFFALGLAVILVYMVMASQFESFLNPFIVMFSVPFSIIGLVAALIVTNTTFNILAFVGAILLVGIVVNNAIVLIDYINILRSRGESLESAIIKGGKTRLKPILMTTLTTVIGLIPMALGNGGGAELRAPMARAVVGGLSTSTFITLFLIPTVYYTIHKRILKRKAKKAGAQNLLPQEA